MIAPPNKGGTFNPKSGFFHAPKPDAPKQADSWWTRPACQQSRDAFRTAFKCESARIIGDPTFDGSKRVHDSGLDN